MTYYRLTFKHCSCCSRCWTASLCCVHSTQPWPLHLPLWWQAFQTERVSGGAAPQFLQSDNFLKPMAPTCNRPACNRQYPHSMGEVSQFIQFTLETSSWTRFPYLSKYFLQELENKKCMVTQHIHWCVIVEGGETWKGSSRPCDTLMGERDAF